MPTYPDVITAVTEIAEAQSVTQLALASVDAKLDEVRSLIQGLQGGTPVTQEQLDALFLALDAVRITTLANRVTADAVLAETTQIVP